MSEQQKACPFCGASGELVERHNPLSKWKYSVDCTSSACGAGGPVESNGAAARAAWNRRAALAAPEQPNTFEVGKPAPYFCPACQAVPRNGYCKLAGCPTVPAALEQSDG